MRQCRGSGVFKKATLRACREGSHSWRNVRLTSGSFRGCPECWCFDTLQTCFFGQHMAKFCAFEGFTQAPLNLMLASYLLCRQELQNRRLEADLPRWKLPCAVPWQLAIVIARHTTQALQTSTRSQMPAACSSKPEYYDAEHPRMTCNPKQMMARCAQ